MQYCSCISGGTDLKNNPDPYRYQISDRRWKRKEPGRDRSSGRIDIIARNLFFNYTSQKEVFKDTCYRRNSCGIGCGKDCLISSGYLHPFLSRTTRTSCIRPENNNLKDLIYTVFGVRITANLLEVSPAARVFTITGYIGKPVIARSNRNYEIYFVNGRYVRSNILSKAIEEAYKPFMMQHKYPFTLLAISRSIPRHWM